ncbi:MAG: hypothetical protein IPP73_07610 [Chitinophagaceae bacterium]|nr:hypothetical protein [Chitinophagaceae bacterium]
MRHPNSEILSYKYWIETAESLKLAADILIENFKIYFNKVDSDSSFLQENNRLLLNGLFQSYTLTLGFSIENLLKGYSIFCFQLSNDFTDVKSYYDIEKLLWKSKNGHNLIAIAQSADLQIFPEEEEFLNRLQIFLLWAGRYRTPKKEHDISLYLKDLFDLTIKSSDEAITSNLFNKIRNFIKINEKLGR